MKKPWVAFVLNLLFFGGGYIYNGKRVGFGAALVLAWVLLRAGEIPIFLTGFVFNWWLILFAGMFVLQLNFAIDALREAKSINQLKK